MATTDSQGNIVITVEDMRGAFPEFADTASFTNAQIQSAITMSGCYISSKNYGNVPLDCRVLMIELMAAHLLKLNSADSSGSSSGSGVPGTVQSASIGQVRVDMVIPTGMNDLKTWLWQTKYGQQYLALVKTYCVPIYYGGSIQRVL